MRFAAVQPRHLHRGSPLFLLLVNYESGEENLRGQDSEGSWKPQPCTCEPEVGHGLTIHVCDNLEFPEPHPFRPLWKLYYVDLV